MKKAVSYCLASSFALILVACASQPALEPTLDFKADYNFEQLASFNILSRRTRAASIIILSDMEIQRVNTAFRQALEKRGLRFEEKAADADILVSWLLITEERTDVRGYDASANYQCWGCGPAVSDISVRDYTQGTLIVDLIDPRLNQSIWRSVVQSRLNNSREVEGQQQRFNQVAERMLEGKSVV